MKTICGSTEGGLGPTVRLVRRYPFARRSSTCRPCHDEAQKRRNRCVVSGPTACQEGKDRLNLLLYWLYLVEVLGMGMTASARVEFVQVFGDQVPVE